MGEPNLPIEVTWTEHGQTENEDFGTQGEGTNSPGLAQTFRGRGRKDLPSMGSRPTGVGMRYNENLEGE